MLTSQQIEQYKEDGAVVVPGVLDAATCKRMKDVLAELVAVDGANFLSMAREI